MVYALIKNRSTYQYLQLFAIVLLPWGLFFSEAVTSILVIIFAFPLLLYGGNFSVAAFIRRFWPFLVIYGLILISGFWSRNTSQWLTLLQANLPYVVLPVSFALWPQFWGGRRVVFIRQFILAGVAISIYLVGMVFFYNDEMMGSIRQGGSFSMPVHHVSTSLFLAVSGVLGWDQWARQQTLSRSFWGHSLGLVLLITGLHLLAVRTGLVLFYLGTIGTFILNKRFHHNRGILAMVGFVVLVILTIWAIPSVREKWQYFLEDLQNYTGNSWWFYSDAVRWESNLLGWEIFRQFPWWGVGMGDVHETMQMHFYTKYEIQMGAYPHNLWLTFLAGTGLVGFALLNLGLAKLYLGLRKKSTLVFRLIFLMYLISCLVENTLLTALGTTSFVILYLMAIDVETSEGPSDPGQN